MQNWLAQFLSNFMPGLNQWMPNYWHFCACFVWLKNRWIFGFNRRIHQIWCMKNAESRRRLRLNRGRSLKVGASFYCNFTRPQERCFLYILKIIITYHIWPKRKRSSVYVHTDCLEESFFSQNDFLRREYYRYFCCCCCLRGKSLIYYPYYVVIHLLSGCLRIFFF